jgi:hypothetical protein
MLIANTAQLYHGHFTVSNYVKKLLVIFAKSFSNYSFLLLCLPSCLKGNLQVATSNCEHYER